MRSILCLMFLFVPVWAFAEETNLEVGSISLPSGYIEHRTGTKDSRMGEITSQSGVLIIHSDIGFSAGTHMYPGRKGECTWYQEQTINGRNVAAGIIEKEGAQQLIITMTGQSTKDAWTLPANFWATITDSKDVADVFLIALSYQPKPQ